ncbi:MAG: YfhO family protein [Oscillospiraceae bacterium]|nr:YfhO family protein [Oscillospiraceae bacterium]
MTRVLQPNTNRRWWENGYVQAFGYGLVLSFLLFIPFIISDSGYFLFYGDFNVQQVPFYQMCHDAIRSGNIFWSSTTDLGANFIGSYTFYLLGSPFFWLTLPFPSEAVPYLMGPLLMLKFACASLTGYVYLKRYAKNQRSAVLGGMLYAFSGFSIYNIFFNHFHEAIIIFPLLLSALDSYMYERRRGIFALTVFASCFMNYYFFVGQVTFVLLYWLVRMFLKSWKISFRDFLWLMFESVLGVVMAGVLLIPSILAVVQNPRVANAPDGWGALLYDTVQRYVHILQSFFFPPDIPARPNFTPDSNSKWASLGAWLPLFSMTGVIAFLQRKQKHWLKVLLPILFLMAFVPILNSSFQLFNSSYYARWFYMLTLMFSLATISSLELEEVNWKRAILWTTGITLGIALPIGLMPKTTTEGDVTTTTYGLEAYPGRFWASVAIALASLLLLTILLAFFRKNQKCFYRLLTGGVALMTLTYGIFFIAQGKSHSDDTHGKIIPYALNGGKDLDLPDLSVVRSDFYKAMDNQAMFWQIPSIQAFHSIVPGSVMEFYPTVGVKRDVASRPDTDCYGIRSLLSCKYLFDYENDSNDFVEQDGETRMPGWVYYDTQNGYKIFENEYYIPMGFSYDHYFTREEYDALGESRRHLMLLKGVVLDQGDVEKVSDLLTSYQSEKSPVYSESAYFKDCNDRKAMACDSFAYDNTGFTATFTADKERLVFFSVPYEDGWSATVNGEAAEILQVNVGFMAVRVPAGQSSIRFDYYTPGLNLGLVMTGVGFGIWLVYLGAWSVIDRRRGNRLPERREKDHGAS